MLRRVRAIHQHVPIELEFDDDVYQPGSLTETVADVMEVRPGDVAVDVGCGTGYLGIMASLLGARHVFCTDPKNRLLFPVGDQEALIQAADRLIKDKALRKRLGRAGNARALSQYSVEREVNEYLSLYEHLLRTTRTSVGPAHSQPLARQA